MLLLKNTLSILVSNYSETSPYSFVDPVDPNISPICENGVSFFYRFLFYRISFTIPELMIELTTSLDFLLMLKCLLSYTKWVILNLFNYCWKFMSNFSIIFSYFISFFPISSFFLIITSSS